MDWTWQQRAHFLWAGLNTGPESPTPTTYLQDNEDGIFTPVALSSSWSDNSWVPIWRQTCEIILFNKFAYITNYLNKYTLTSS